MALFKRKNKEDGQKFKSLLNTPRLDLRHSIPSAIAKVKALNGCSVIECMPGSDKTVYMINGIGVF